MFCEELFFRYGYALQPSKIQRSEEKGDDTSRQRERVQ